MIIINSKKSLAFNTSVADTYSYEVRKELVCLIQQHSG
jgi:hypothetical protein